MSSPRPDRLGCPDFHRALRADLVSRRGLLKVGVAGGGWSLSQLLASEARAAAVGGKPSRVNSVIILWMRGGPAQHETWDPKPDAPEEYRGELGHINTSVPGILINELL